MLSHVAMENHHFEWLNRCELSHWQGSSSQTLQLPEASQCLLGRSYWLINGISRNIYIYILAGAFHVGNGWVAGGCWDGHLMGRTIIRFMGAWRYFSEKAQMVVIPGVGIQGCKCHLWF